MIALILFLFILVAPVNALNVKVWRGASGNPKPSDYPEMALDEIKSKSNVAIGLSGGGSRSFSASVGYLAALTQLGVMDKVRYIGGISGGSWATTVYTYAQNVSDDNVLLGPIVEPENINYDDLQVIDDGCVRSLTKEPVTLVALRAIKEKKVASLSDAYCYALQKTYLDPVGITENTRFSWSTATVEDIKKRNPELNDEVFVLPGSTKRPFMVVGSAIVGPSEGAPYRSNHHNMSMMEFTPLYVGVMRNLDISYDDGSDLGPHWIKKKNTFERHIGGFIEPFAFAAGSPELDGVVAPDVGLAESDVTGILSVPSPNDVVDLSHVTGASGYAPGAFLEASYIPSAAEMAGMHYSYWSPADMKPQITDMLYTDGGCFENDALIPFLQRGVKKIVLFVNAGTPMKPAEDWNVDVDEHSNDQIDDNLQSFFGILMDNKEIYQRSFQMDRNHVFPQEEYSNLIHKLQSAQAEGKGLIARMNLVTIANEWWGIPAGFEVDVTFVYLGRLSVWEKMLPADMQSRVIPTDGNPDDLSNTIDSGEFKHFPHYQTAGGLLSYAQSNLLSDMTGWSVLQNKELFLDIFAPLNI